MVRESLDLYAKIEPLIGFYESYEALYTIYREILETLGGKSLLDVGCGNGNFLLSLGDSYAAEGIDLSEEMVKIANQKGVKARSLPLSLVEESYDIVVAIADVLNYMPKKDLRSFFNDLEARLKEGGFFVCDINTLYGFEEVTAGSFNKDLGDRFVGIDAEFERGVLQTQITYFSQTQDRCYTKESAEILQYYHSVEDLASLAPLGLVGQKEVALFGEESDKTILIFQKRQAFNSDISRS